MKNLLIIITVVGFTVFSACQQDSFIPETQVPQVVQNTFKSMYSDATKVKWTSGTIETGTIYEAEFKINRDKKEAEFSSDGSWMETETEIKISDLPAAVASSLAINYPGYEIEEADMIETSEAGIFYEVEIEDESNDSELEVTLDQSGNVISIEQENDDDHQEGNDSDEDYDDEEG